jgi:hypothetical protein
MCRSSVPTFAKSDGLKLEALVEVIPGRLCSERAHWGDEAWLQWEMHQFAADCYTVQVQQCKRLQPARTIYTVHVPLSRTSVNQHNVTTYSGRQNLMFPGISIMNSSLEKGQHVRDFCNEDPLIILMPEPLVALVLADAWKELMFRVAWSFSRSPTSRPFPDWPDEEFRRVTRKVWVQDET